MNVVIMRDLKQTSQDHLFYLTTQARRLVFLRLFIYYGDSIRGKKRISFQLVTKNIKRFLYRVLLFLVSIKSIVSYDFRLLLVRKFIYYYLPLFIVIGKVGYEDRENIPLNKTCFKTV